MDRFIVGTGRCGSTLLSLMVADHPDVVTLHEFFTGLDWAQRFRVDTVTGGELAAILGAEQPVTTEVLARGHTSDEIRYPFGAPQARYQVGDPVPWLLITMLSRLTDDPDPLFDAFIDEARRRPPATMAEHYRHLFAWVAGRFEGSSWVERSGSSLDYLGTLLDVFPDARFVHIHRDGLEAALSIRAHRFFRLGVAVFFDLFPRGVDEATAITHVIDTPPPLSAAGQYWSDQVLRGFAALPRLDRDQYLEVRFEDLCSAPAETLERVAVFLDLPDRAAWIGAAAARVTGLPPSRADGLSHRDRAELEAACRPGQVLLGRA